MKRGLVIGKFLPLHNGHIALINFAASQCDELIVSMSYTVHDFISPSVRLNWLVKCFEGRPSIQPKIILDDFDDETLDWAERTKIWADVISKIYPPIHFLFSSEIYGDYFANHLNAVHIEFDKQRELIPVSATKIRSNPFQYWNYIPKIVKPYFVKRICFYGPESTGKSFMAKKMAEKYQTAYVPEVARELITSNIFNREDIITIGRTQTERVFEMSRKANRVLFCDTDLITTQIYSRVYLKVVPPILYQLEKMVEYDLYFLFDVDVPWVSDGLRDLGETEKRSEMHAIFKNELDSRGLRYENVSGNWDERERIIEYHINLLLT